MTTSRTGVERPSVEAPPLPQPGRHRGPLALDLALAHWIRRQALDDGLTPDGAELLARTTVLLGQERGRGHACLRLARWAGRPMALPETTPAPASHGTPETTASVDYELPQLPRWLQLLQSTALVGDGRHPTPLVLGAKYRLYLYRYWAAEQRLSGHLQKLLDGSAPAFDIAQLAPLFQRLFPIPDDGNVDHQALAAALALRRRLCLISGGPGTGKTTTVSRILALWLTSQPGLRITLAAPTGKAAGRLAESIGQQMETLNLPQHIAEKVPRTASTLHRLLGYRRQQRRFRHHPGHPLPCDILVVDEASMVDLLMMDVLVAALPTGGRLVLLGDRDQLSSVETGFVFGDLCQGAGQAGLSPAFTEYFAELSGASMQPTAPPELSGHPLRDAAVELNINYRFRDQPGIGALARAIRQQEIHQALAVLDDSDFTDTARRPHARDDGRWLSPVQPLLRAVFAAPLPSDALLQLNRFRILAALRKGPWGVEQLNREIEDWLQHEGLIHATPRPFDEDGSRWYPGRPIMVTHNDYNLRLFNGDVGICALEEGQLRAFFPDEDSGLRSLPLGKLPPHETAWAMTVHKSQGSEFDHVLLVLPEDDSPILSRELLYTAVTRARRALTVIASASLLETTIERRSRRASGLLDALVGHSGPPAETECIDLETTDNDGDRAPSLAVDRSSVVPAPETSAPDTTADEPCQSATESSASTPERAADTEPVQLSLFPTEPSN